MLLVKMGWLHVSELFSHFNPSHSCSSILIILSTCLSRLAHRDLLLLGEDGLVAVGLGQRTRGGGGGRRGVGLGLDLGLLEGQRPLGVCLLCSFPF